MSMTFETVIEDLQRMTGMRLESVRPGADIILNEINVAQDRIVITSQAGATKSRPLNELRIIWQKLHEQPAVHVDEALHGSGTSRNQPETIMANLAYIEWFKFNNKKHIALVGKNSHSFGTKRQMDEANAEVLRERLRGNTFDDLATVVITREISKAVHLYESMTGISAIPVCSDVYLFGFPGKSVAFISAGKIDQAVPEGTYAVINKPAGFALSQQVQINGDQFCAKSIGGLNLLIRL